MSREKGVNERYFQTIQLEFKSSDNHLSMEKWNFVKNNNVKSAKYDFIQDLIIDNPY